MARLNRGAVVVSVLALSASALSGCNGGLNRKISSPQAGSVAPIRATYAPKEITQLCDAAITRYQKVIAEIVAIPAAERTLENTLLRYEAAGADFGDEAQPLVFMGSVSPVETTQEEAQGCEERIGQVSVEIGTRKDLYQAIASQADRIGSRSAEEQRLYSETVRGFENNGLKLSDAELAKYRELSKKLSSASIRFASNLAKDVTKVSFTAVELDGVSEDFLKSLPTEDGKLVVTVNSSSWTEVMERAKRGATRKRMMAAYYNRAAEVNTPILQDTVALRLETARALGFRNWAEYRIRGRMAPNAAAVMDFLGGLKEKLAQRNRDDLAQFLAFKKSQSPGDPDANQINAWDINYAIRGIKREQLQLDEEEARQYFPADTVIAGMYRIYSTLLGVKFTEVVGAPVWHPSVKLYRVDDAATGQPMSYFYTDYFPRERKYGHAAAFGIIYGRKLPNGGYQMPVASIVANLSPPTPGKPSLMKHDDVVTMFHEFGHIMHFVLTRAPYASLSGYNVAHDLVEAPSQMLENWMYSPEMLSLVSGHYLHPEQKIPASLIQKLIATRNVGRGYFYTRQLYFGLMDMAFHSAEGPVNVLETQDRYHREILGLAPIENNHFVASFGHLMGGYDAGYYGYLWSDVYAADMFSRFEAEGLLNPTVGGDYRRAILEQGSMKDGMTILREFLGREPNSDAFFRNIGLTPN